MAPRARAAKAAPESEEIEQEVDIDLAVYADKNPTPVAQAFSEWITDQTGYEVDEKSVYLAMSLRRKFQHDEATRERIAEIREERKPAREEPAEKAPAARRGASSKVTSTSTTSKAPARTTAKAATAKPTPPRRGRKPAAAATATAEAPF